MITVLLGDTRDPAFLKEIESRKWGRICVTMTPAPYDGEPWAFDNGAFAAWLEGSAFPVELFLTRLDRAHALPSKPMMAVAPDKVGAGMESLEFRMIMDEVCICGHDKEQHEMLTHPIGVGCCLATSDCCCEGYLPADEPRNGDPAQAEPPELSGRGWGLGPFDRS